LIDNAIKYNEKGTSISIKTSQDKKYVYWEVTDNGIGIPAKEKQKIFDKFYRLESALTQKTKGTGLGLSLVKHIMLAHKGEVLVESKLGKGSTFTLKFPRENKK
jgi:two-component system phosphate regulon sensor histidine kinase PhoR